MVAFDGCADGVRCDPWQRGAFESLLRMPAPCATCVTCFSSLFALLGCIAAVVIAWRRQCQGGARSTAFGTVVDDRNINSPPTASLNKDKELALRTMSPSSSTTA